MPTVINHELEGKVVGAGFPEKMKMISVWVVIVSAREICFWAMRRARVGTNSDVLNQNI
jgi:hypothetical protein